MRRESRLILELWDVIRDHVPPGKRGDTALAMMTLLQDYGMERDDLCDVVDEDPHLTRAFHSLFDDDDEAEDEEASVFDDQDDE